MKSILGNFSNRSFFMEHTRFEEEPRHEAEQYAICTLIESVIPNARKLEGMSDNHIYYEQAADSI